GVSTTGSVPATRRRGVGARARAAGRRTVAARCSPPAPGAAPRPPHPRGGAGHGGGGRPAPLPPRAKGGSGRSPAAPTTPWRARAYAKGIDRIAGVLAAAGASEAALALQERAVVGSTRARANRLANADHANLVRTGRAAHAQLEAVRRLQRDGRLDQLSPLLR